jgi:hypothetical protein
LRYGEGEFSKAAEAEDSLSKELEHHQHHPRKMMAHHFLKVIDLARGFGGNQSLLEKLGTTRVLQSVGRENLSTVKAG